MAGIVSASCSRVAAHTSASEQTDELIFVDDFYGTAAGGEDEGFAVFAASA